MEHDKVLSEQARLVRSRQIRSLPSALGVVLLVSTLMADSMPMAKLGGWLASIAALLALRSLFWWRQAPAATGDAARRHLRFSLAWTAVISAACCAGVLLFGPYLAPEYQILMLCVVIATGIQGMFVLGAHFPSFALLLAPIGCASIWVQWRMPQHAAPGIIGFTLLLTVFLLLCARHFNGVILAAIRSRQTGLDLVAQLETQKGVAEALAASRARFLAAASHDLRQPMHALSLYLAALHDTDWQSPAAAAMLADARRCARNMEYQFRCLLEMARLDSGSMPVEASTFPIELILNQLHSDFAAASLQCRIPLKIAACDAAVHSDPALVERILHNLVANALRHAGHGRVLVGCRQRGERLLVSVYDTGCGIAADQQDLVFEEFYQVNNAHRDPARGLGLGLALGRRMAKLLDTALMLRSEPGCGSRFQFELPLASPAGRKRGPRLRGLRSLQVLVIDDDPFLLQHMHEQIARWHCQVIRATSSREAIRLLSDASRAPDLIVVDYQLHEENAFNVIEAVQDEFNVAIPALILAGMADLQAVLDRGVTVLRKPVRSEELLAVMKSLLPNASLRQG